MEWICMGSQRDYGYPYLGVCREGSEKHLADSADRVYRYLPNPAV